VLTVYLFGLIKQRKTVREIYDYTAEHYSGWVYPRVCGGMLLTSSRQTLHVTQASLYIFTGQSRILGQKFAHRPAVGQQTCHERDTQPRPFYNRLAPEHVGGSLYAIPPIHDINEADGQKTRGNDLTLQ